MNMDKLRYFAESLAEMPNLKFAASGILPQLQGKNFTFAALIVGLSLL